MEKKIRIVARFIVFVLPIILSATMLWNPDPRIVGLTDNPDSLGFLTYHFFHASWFHLAINWWCLTGLVLRYDFSVAEIMWCYMLASLYPFATDVPVVGMSGIAFAMIGLITHTMKQQWQFIAVSIASCIVTAFVPHMAWGLHLWCYITGLLTGSTMYGIKWQRKHTERE